MDERTVDKGRRSYHTQAALKFMGGTIPPETAAALSSALRSLIDEAVLSLSTEALPPERNVFAVSATVRERTSAKAMAVLDTAVDRSLIRTGLFEEFDATGRVLRVAPVEWVPNDSTRTMT
jgi:hypothetical protein